VGVNPTCCCVYGRVRRTLVQHREGGYRWHVQQVLLSWYGMSQRVSSSNSWYGMSAPLSLREHTQRPPPPHPQLDKGNYLVSLW
jgi:hypothetical protein